MASIALEDSADPICSEPDGAHGLCHAVRVILAIYLMPVVGLVCLIGGAAIAADRAGRWISGQVGPRLGTPRGETSPIPRPRLARERRTDRVGR